MYLLIIYPSHSKIIDTAIHSNTCNMQKWPSTNVVRDYSRNIKLFYSDVIFLFGFQYIQLF